MFYYFVISFIIFSLVLLVFRKCLLKCMPIFHHIKRTHKEVVNLIALEKMDMAEKILQPLIEKKLGFPFTIVLYTQLLRKTNRLNQAYDHIKTATESFPNELTLYSEQAKILLALGEPQESLNAFKKCYKILKHEEDIIDLSTAFIQANDNNNALKQLEYFIPTTKNGKLLSVVADCHFNKSNYEEAIIFYEKAQKHGFNNHHVMYHLGCCFKYISQIDIAKQYFYQLLEYDPGDVLAALAFGNCLESEALYHEALLCYQSSKIWDHGHPNILLQAGICALHLHKYEYAELYIHEALKRGLPTPRVMALLGYSLERQHKWEDAEKMYLKLIEKFPKHMFGYKALAWMYGVGLSTTIDAHTGLAFAHKALQLHPDTNALEILSACEARSGNFSQAYNIQEHLSVQTQDKEEQKRCQHAMRSLRKKNPLTKSQVSHALVA